MENQNFVIQAWKTWKISVGQRKSWKIRLLLDQWIILSQFSSLAFSTFLGPPMNVKNIAKIVSTILVTLIYHSLAVHFNSEAGSQPPLWFDGAPCSASFVVSSFSKSWILENMVMESDAKVMEFWCTSSVRTLSLISFARYVLESICIRLFRANLAFLSPDLYENLRQILSRIDLAPR